MRAGYIFEHSSDKDIYDPSCKKDRPDEASVIRFEDEYVLNTDTIIQATILARKVLQALAHEHKNEEFSSTKKSKEGIFFSLESRRNGKIQLLPPNIDSTIPVSANPLSLTNLNRTETLLPRYSDQFEELVTSSYSNGLPVLENDSALDFIRSIDDVNTTLDNMCSPREANDQSGFNDKLETVQVETNTSAIDNPVWSSLKGLETYEQISGGGPVQDTYSLPTFEKMTNAENEFLQDMLPEDVLFHDTNATLTTSVEAFASNTKDDSKPGILDRKSTRDRRRAIARRRTILKRRGEEQSRMRKLVNDLSNLPEAERVVELTKLKNEALQREEQRRTEQRRVSSREAVQKCRGKAGSTKQELESNLRLLHRENEKLKKVLIVLAQSGCVTIEEFRKQGIIVNNALNQGCSLNIDVCPGYLQGDAKQWD